MFEFAIIDSLGAEPALLYCSLGLRLPHLYSLTDSGCMFFFFFFFFISIHHLLRSITLITLFFCQSYLSSL